MDELDMYCKYVFIPLKKEYDNYKYKLSKKLFITKKDKEILRRYESKLEEAIKKVENLILENHKIYKKLIEYGILSP